MRFWRGLSRDEALPGCFCWVFEGLFSGFRVGAVKERRDGSWQIHARPAHVRTHLKPKPSRLPKRCKNLLKPPKAAPRNAPNLPPETPQASLQNAPNNAPLRFVVVHHGLEERRTPGNTLAVQPDKPYQGLSGFGTGGEGGVRRRGQRLWDGWAEEGVGDWGRRRGWGIGVGAGCQPFRLGKTDGK